MASSNLDSEDDVFGAFNKILGFARDLNTQLPAPEIVVIGKQGAGKSSLIEAFFGHPVSMIAQSKDSGTKRPVFFSLINKPSCAHPRLVVRRDAMLKEFPLDTVLTPANFEAELSARNVSSWVPLHFNYEYRHCWDITFIDTPGLLDPNEKDPKAQALAEAVEQEVLDLCRPAHRIIVVVEEVKDGSTSQVALSVKKVDPKLDRTVFVFNKFADQIRTFTSSRDVNKYLLGVMPVDVSSIFFTSLPANRDAKLAIAEYEALLNMLLKDDLEVLEQLQFDKRFSGSIGVPFFKKHILELTWRKYQDSIPELLKRLRAFKKNSDESLLHIQQQLSTLDSNSNLRGAASKFVTQFVQSIEKLLSGTLEGNPSINGQTLDDEKDSDETGSWKTCDFAPLKLSAEVYDRVPHADSKLYGGQQFERLLAEFRVVSDQLRLGFVGEDEIATAAGPNKVTNASNFIWAASDIAQKQLQRALLPLIEQLFRRAVYVMKRLVNVADSMIASQAKSVRRSTAHGGVLDDVTEYPFFTHKVKDLYFSFIDKTSEECKKKCLDEFLSTRLIHWEAINLDGAAAPTAKVGSAADAHKEVLKKADEIFERIRNRVTKNVVLKTYNYFLVPLQTSLWTEIQGNITCLPDVDLKELFEVSASVSRLKDEEQRMQGIIRQFGEQESFFLLQAQRFSKRL
eukprot:TRINITY_DN22350_c0_g1_i1.p1 TRINITY_DN22350_c0_g1~~TRINITY_DN22350_c0_g1_i1.p1  ORF type:complete len:681 (-),score=139.34 TRINITY_DN22350_c0_g1_i1:83-2125(-)